MEVEISGDCVEETEMRKFCVDNANNVLIALDRK